MAFNLNVVHLAGHLTKNPEYKAAGSSHVCTFSFAVNKRFKTKDGQLKDKVAYIDCEAWGKTGELIAQYLTKGSAAYICGEIAMDQWDDKTTGQKRQKLKVIADEVQFISAKPAEGSADEPPTSPTVPAQTDDTQPPF